MSKAMLFTSALIAAATSSLLAFDCVVYPASNPSTCYACSNCTVNNVSGVTCGDIEKAASCPEGCAPECTVTSFDGVPSYSAKCNCPVGPEV